MHRVAEFVGIGTVNTKENRNSNQTLSAFEPVYLVNK